MSDPVLVIGGTRGTGLLIARLLRRHGYQVRVLARVPARAAPRLDSAVEVITGDITKPDTLVPAVQGASHIIFTAGVQSGRIAREYIVKMTDYRGVVNTLDVARDVGFAGRFLYLNTIGIRTPSLSGHLLNLLKRNVLVWRRHVEEEIRSSGLSYTIIRAGFLLNGPGGQRALEVTQGALPLSPRYRIARADVAEGFVAALEHPRTSRTTLEVVSGRGERREDWRTLLGRVTPDG
jgi:uncharacterized protein YbjT (DUF2867 family)